MLTEDQITALAREYAEEECERLNLPTDCCEPVAEDYEKFLRFLLRQFCLVEKSRVTEEYKRAIETNRKGRETGAHSLCTMGSARKVLLESLFPEIAKEVEE